MLRRLLALALLLGLLTACSLNDRADLPPSWYHPDPGLAPGKGVIDPDDGFQENLAQA